jgi:hypothetical protein
MPCALPQGAAAGPWTPKLTSGSNGHASLSCLSVVHVHFPIIVRKGMISAGKPLTHIPAPCIMEALPMRPWFRSAHHVPVGYGGPGGGDARASALSLAPAP